MNQPTDAADKPLVLIADDDAAHRRVLQNILEKAGFRVDTAENGKIALEKYAELNPDAVLLDVEMPELDGFSVCEAIRAEEQIRETPIFIITGREDEEAVERAYSVGATDFLNKPIALTVLPHRIQYVLRTSTSLNDLRGLIRAIPDLIFVVNADGDVQEGLSRGDATHTQQIQALSTASVNQGGLALATHELRLDSLEPGVLGAFELVISYDIPYAQYVRVAIREGNANPPGLRYFSSVEVWLKP